MDHGLRVVVEPALEVRDNRRIVAEHVESSQEGVRPKSQGHVAWKGIDDALSTQKWTVRIASDVALRRLSDCSEIHEELPLVRGQGREIRQHAAVIVNRRMTSHRPVCGRPTEQAQLQEEIANLEQRLRAAADAGNVPLDNGDLVWPTLASRIPFDHFTDNAPRTTLLKRDIVGTCKQEQVHASVEITLCDESVEAGLDMLRGVRRELRTAAEVFHPIV